MCIEWILCWLESFLIHHSSEILFLLLPPLFIFFPLSASPLDHFRVFFLKLVFERATGYLRECFLFTPEYKWDCVDALDNRTREQHVVVQEMFE